MHQISPDRVEFFHRALVSQRCVITHDVIGYVDTIEVGTIADTPPGAKRFVGIETTCPVGTKPLTPEAWDIAIRLANWRRSQYSAMDRNPMTDAPCTIIPPLPLPGRCCS